MSYWQRYGKRRTTQVSEYKRGKQGRTKTGKYSRKKRVSAHSRQTRNWGSPGGIPLKPVVRVKRNFHIDFRRGRKPKVEKLTEIFDKYIDKSQNRKGRFYTLSQAKENKIRQLLLDFSRLEHPLDSLRKIYHLIPEIIKRGIRSAIDEFEQKHAGRIPQNTGRLRNALISNLRKAVGKFPVIVKWGAPKLKYASIVNRYTPVIQIRHTTGLQKSGRGKQKYEYFVQKGDPDVIYHYYDNLGQILPELIHKKIKDLVDSYNVPRYIFDWLVNYQANKVKHN